MVGPAPSPAAMIGWTARADDLQRSRRARHDSGLGVRRRSWLYHRSICAARIRRTMRWHVVVWLATQFSTPGFCRPGSSAYPRSAFSIQPPPRTRPHRLAGGPAPVPPTAGHHRPAPAGWRPAARLARVQAWPGSAIWRCAAVRAVLAAATAAVSAWQNAYQQVSPVSPSGRICPCFHASDVSRRARFSQIGRVEPFSEPIIDRCKQVAGVLGPSLVRPEAR